MGNLQRLCFLNYQHVYSKVISTDYLCCLDAPQCLKQKSDFMPLALERLSVIRSSSNALIVSTLYLANFIYTRLVYPLYFSKSALQFHVQYCKMLFWYFLNGTQNVKAPNTHTVHLPLKYEPIGLLNIFYMFVQENIF